MALVIDSSVFVTLDRIGGTLDDLRDASPPGEVFIAGIGASELVMGVLQSDQPALQQRRRIFVEAILGEIPVLPFDLRVARIHARLVLRLSSEERQIGCHDVQTAATAVAHGYDLLTENSAPFERITGLTIHQPNW